MGWYGEGVGGPLDSCMIYPSRYRSPEVNFKQDDTVEFLLLCQGHFVNYLPECSEIFSGIAWDLVWPQNDCLQAGLLSQAIQRYEWVVNENQIFGPSPTVRLQ